MHILYLMPATGFGGAERQGVLHIRWLRDLGHRVTAVVGQSAPMKRLLNDVNEDTIWLDEFPPAFATEATVFARVAQSAKWVLGVERVARQLTPLVAARQVDVILANRTFAWLVAGQISRHTGCPFVLRAGSRPRKTYFARGLKLFAAFNAEPVLFVSNCRAVEESYRAFLSVPRMILPNAVDLTVFQPGNGVEACERLGLNPKRPRVALAIRPSTDKGLPLLCDVARRTRTVQPLVEFVIAGDYPERQHYVLQVEQQGLADTIRFLGHLDDVSALYAASDLVLLTSPQESIEGSPNALLEAMACSKPVVATAVGGIPELFEDGKEGFLVPETEPSSVACTIEWLLRNAQLRTDMGIAGRKRAQREHAPEAIARQLASRITSCIQPSSAIGGPHYAY